MIHKCIHMIIYQLAAQFKNLKSQLAAQFTICHHDRADFCTYIDV